jgi:tetratricopeptide (TPR) repeat protein
VKIATNLILCSFLLIGFSACAGARIGSEVQTGRQALLAGNPERALGYFQSAAQQDPSYVYGTALQHGIWGYVGRSEYATGRLAQARESLEKALSVKKDDDTARLYLGLTLARSGDRQRIRRVDLAVLCPRCRAGPGLDMRSIWSLHDMCPSTLDRGRAILEHRRQTPA